MTERKGPSNINHITISGFLVEDAKLIKTEKPGLSFRVANNYYSKKENEGVNYLDCSYWKEKHVPHVVSFLKKGTRVLVSGQLRCTSKKDGDTWKNYTSILVNELEIVGNGKHAADDIEDEAPDFAPPPAGLKTSKSTPKHEDQDIDLPSDGFEEGW